MKKIYLLFVLVTWGISSIAQNAPKANFSPSYDSICALDYVQFTDSSTNNPTSWLWHFPGGNPNVDSTRVPNIVVYDTSGSFDVTLIVSNMYGSDTLTRQRCVVVSPSPPAPVISQLHDTLFCSTDTSYISYQWYSGKPISGATHSFYVTSSDSTYQVDVQNKYGCEVVSAYYSNTGINVITDYQSIAIYPNPANGKIAISFSHTVANGSLKIFNVVGEEIYSEQLADAPFTRKEIALNVPAGIYFVQVISGEQQWMEKVVKE